MNAQAVAKIETPVEPQAVPNEATSMMAMIARAAADPSCDLDKMERLLAMHERMVGRQAQAEFAADLAAMQAELPSIGERGQADRYKFALWEDINQAIKPVMQRFGFALTFRTETQEGKITVTGVLSHRSGHQEKTSITLTADTSGSKNAVQAVGSSTSYGKRYTAGALLNLTSHGEDDDAFSATSEYITEAQEINLRERLEACGANIPGFLKFLKVEALSKIRAKDFDKAVKAVEAKERAAK